MFDTMTMTKVVGGACGALLVFMLGKWVAEEMYFVDAGHGSHEDAVTAFFIDTGSPAEKEEEIIDVAAILETGDPDKGATVFKKCAACHKLEEGANATGPSLHALVGRPVDAIPDFNYSGALEQVGEVWTPENLFTFLKSPKAAAPGTSMGFVGLKKDTDRANIIAFLKLQQ